MEYQQPPLPTDYLVHHPHASQQQNGNGSFNNSTNYPPQLEEEEEEEDREVVEESKPKVSTTNGNGKRPSGSVGGKKIKSGGGGGGEGEVKYDKDGNVKKKRKQLVACDSCRLRRVKCDRSEKMGGACSECEKKKITCTDTYVKNKPKTVRSGKLIQQAKALFGDDPTKPSPSPTAPHARLHSSSADSPSLPPPPSLTPSQAQTQTTPRPPSRQDLISLAPSSSQSRLVQTQITRDISSELIRTYFSILHQVCPLVDQELFESAWNLAGQISENLTPAGECLAAVLQAWAARASDNPLIVGFGAPSLEDLRNSKGGGGGTGGRDFTLVGNRREDFAIAMKDRALRLIDDKGLLRISSSVACSALTLMEFLVTFDDTSRVKTRGRYLMVGACEHLRNLNEGQCDDLTEPVCVPERVSNGTLLWMVYTRDALVALIGGRPSCFSEDDLTSLCDLFTNPITADVLPYISSTDARMLSGLAVASMFRHVVASIRRSITLLTSPLARRSPLVESTLTQIWSEIDTSSRYASIFRQSVDNTNFGEGEMRPKTHVWFRDLIGIKGQHLLGIHGMLCRRLDAEEERVAKEGGEGKEGEGSESYVEMLRRVKESSDERFLEVSREWTAMLRTYGTELLFSAFFTVEYTKDYLQHMIEAPSWEQGGSRSYTWSSKVDECQALIDIMQMVGWSWGGFDRLITQARHSLARQGHRLEQHQLAQQQQAHQRHQTYPQQPQQPYHTTVSPYNQTPSSNPWPPHSHSHSHPNVSLPSSHSYSSQAVSLPPPAPVSYYDSPDLNLAYSLPPTSTAPSSSSLAPQANGITSYSHTPPQSILSPSFSQGHSTSSNPAFYHYHQAHNGGEQLPPVNVEMNGNGVNGYGQNGRGGGGAEIERLPSIVYGNGTI